MSGLTVGYLSIDDLVLELRAKSGTDEEKEQASKVLPILSDRHWLLVTLLLMNACGMEALPIFLNKVVPEYLAVLISVSLVLLFGEVIPQAYCTGPDQVKIAAKVAPLTKLLMTLSSPLSYPIAKILDRILGEHHKSRFLNNDLKTLIELHTYNSLEKLNVGTGDNESTGEVSGKMGLHDEQANLMISALEMREKKVIELMIPIKNTFMIDLDEVLDKFKVNIILDKGYSRIPLFNNHNRNDIAGLLRIKQLIGVDFKQNKTLRQLGVDIRKPLVISPRLSLLDLLREFRKGKSHMAFITEQVEELQAKYGLNLTNSFQKEGAFFSGKNTNSTKNIKILGIITLEDVIERMINLDILDEDDYERAEKTRRNPISKLSKIIGKEFAKSLIRDESFKLDMLIKESFSRKKSIKDMLMLKRSPDETSSMNNTPGYLKDNLI